jgi:hypothetical protein
MAARLNRTGFVILLVPEYTWVSKRNSWCAPLDRKRSTLVQRGAQQIPNRADPLLSYFGIPYAGVYAG